MENLEPICQALIARLQSEKDSGETGLALTPQARADVLALSKSGAGRRSSNARASQQRPAPSRQSSARPAPEPERERERPTRLAAPVVRPEPASQEPAATSAERSSLVNSLLRNEALAMTVAQPASGEPPSAPLTGSKVEQITAIRRRVWEKFSANPLESLRKTMVFSVGNTDARLMLVGEAPGAEEERRYEPFVGPAGQTLTKMLVAMGLEREEVYISNIVKFRPIKTPGSEVGNRPPTPEEIAQFREYVLEEARVIKPEIIIALGGTATKGLLQIDGAMKNLHGRFHDLDGMPVMVTYHPSWLLQYGTLANKRTVWEDLLLVMERLGMPISGKQRGFFLPKE